MLHDEISDKLTDLRDKIIPILLSSTDLSVEITECKLALLKKTCPDIYDLALEIAIADLSETEFTQ